MKEENKRKNVHEELSHAEDSFKAAGILIDAELFREAVPKLYYALFHILRALLFTKGLEPKSHKGVSHYFDTHFVKTRIFTQELHRFFQRFMKYRHDADYDLDYEISAEDCKEWYGSIEEFIGEAKDYIKDQSEW